jgi:RNA recognition motif-containing protein
MVKRTSHHAPSFDGGGGPGGGGRSNKRRKPSPAEGGNSGGGDTACNVFVGNLKYGTTWWALKDHMRQAGNVDSANILESNGRSKGCAVVKYQHPKEAQRAIRELNESLLDDRKIFVQPDTSSRDSSNDNNGDRGRDRGSGDVGRHENNNNMSSSSGGGSHGIYVGNLPYECSWQALKDFFKSCGQIDRADVIEDPVTKRKKGWGVVFFSNDRAVETAIRKFHGADFQGRTLEVRRDKKSSSMTVQQPRGNGNDDDDKFKLHVGNLDYDCSWQDLKDLVQKRCGQVEHADIPKRGWGVVTFATHRDGAAAISRLDGSVFQNRPLEVRWYRKTGGSGGNDQHNDEYRDNRNPSSSSSSSSSSSLYVGNLSYDCTWQDLKDAFKRYGHVSHAEVCETAGGKSTGFGIVLFSDGKSAAKAMDSMDGVEFQGRKLSVRWDRSPDKLQSSERGGGSKRDQRDNNSRGKKDSHHRGHQQKTTNNRDDDDDKIDEEMGDPLDNALSCPR